MNKSERYMRAVLIGQPMWCCNSCGKKYGNRIPDLATYHMDYCGVCGEKKEVTEPRDFGYLKPEWRNHELHRLEEKK